MLRYVLVLVLVLLAQGGVSYGEVPIDNDSYCTSMNIKWISSTWKLLSTKLSSSPAWQNTCLYWNGFVRCLRLLKWCERVERLQSYFSQSLEQWTFSLLLRNFITISFYLNQFITVFSLLLLPKLCWICCWIQFNSFNKISINEYQVSLALNGRLFQFLTLE